mmetsp:Transcript_12338/g.37956  ORF Transcript_12338/g.37956 Transcript_12338/m.37956 type:complete len:161 (+) Transcript_12338:290-772(+)
MDGPVDVPALAKGLNIVVAALVVICSIVFMASQGSYLSVLVGLETMLFAAVLGVVETRADPPLSQIRAVAPFLCTPPGELFVSGLAVLFVFAMGAFGIAMGMILCLTLGLNAYVIQAHPDAAADLRDPDDAGPGAAAPFHGGYEDDSPYAPKTQPSTADL